MKVKKIYLFIAGTTSLIGLIMVIGIFIIILNMFELSFQDGSNFVKRGFTLNPAKNDEITGHITDSQKKIDLLHYELNINLIPSEEKIDCKSIITGIPIELLNGKIELNFNDGFYISTVLFNGTETMYKYDDDILSIILDSQVTDTFKIEINYSGTPESLGFGSFTFGEHNEESVIYSLSEPIFASTWFPCNDIPTDKVLTDIYITNDIEMTSVSNGIFIGSEVYGDKKTYHWKTIYPISTYLISIYSANYKQYQDKYISLDNDTMMIDYYVFEDDLNDAKKDFNIHPTAMKHLSELFGEYPFIKEKYGVAEFLWNFGAMEHQTITGIGKRFIGGNQFFTDMLVHELAHQWWGNAVTLKTWKDIWLNEGFATYSEALYWEKESGVSALKSTMRSFLTDFGNTKLYNPEKLFSRVIYNKGAWVLHMLRRELGDDIFFKILREYYKKYKYSNASTADFIFLVESISKRDFTEYFNQWVFEGEGKIELEYEYRQNSKNNQYQVDLILSQVQEGYENYEFVLDLDVYLEDGSRQRDSIRVKNRNSNYSFSYETSVTKIELDPENWLAADIFYLNPDEE
jgi:aminopeptidase N